METVIGFAFLTIYEEMFRWFYKAAAEKDKEKKDEIKGERTQKKKKTGGGDAVNEMDVHTEVFDRTGGRTKRRNEYWGRWTVPGEGGNVGG